MSAVESFDGLCGMIHRYAKSSKQVRCLHEFGHDGEHSWVKNELKQSGSIRFVGLFVHEVKYTF